MTRHPRATLVATLGVFLASGCQSLSTPAPSQPSAPAAQTAQTQTIAAPRDAHEQLQALLWMQTSGEYWAAAMSTYAAARRAIDLGLKDRTWTAAVEQEGAFGRLPPAVILDLDETVLDNSRFQGRMVREQKSYDPAEWDVWVDQQSAGEIPGAVGFVHYAESKNVRVFFVTNRTGAQEQATIANLARMTITATPETILSSQENGWTSDKSPRRAFLAAKYRILALVGDDLNDFISATNLSASDRLKTADKNGARWGVRWFIVPNPVYGGWERSLTPGLTDDAAILAKKRSLVTAF